MSNVYTLYADRADRQILLQVHIQMCIYIYICVFYKQQVRSMSTSKTCVYIEKYIYIYVWNVILKYANHDPST